MFSYHLHLSKDLCWSLNLSSLELRVIFFLLLVSVEGYLGYGYGKYHVGVISLNFQSFNRNIYLNG